MGKIEMTQPIAAPPRHVFAFFVPQRMPYWYGPEMDTIGPAGNPVTFHTPHGLHGLGSLMPKRLSLSSPTFWATTNSIFEQVFWIALFALQAPLLGPRAFGLIALAAVHRLAFSGDDDARFHELGTTLMSAALIPLAFAIAADSAVAAWKLSESELVSFGAAIVVACLLLGLWYALPLILRRRQPL